MTDNQHVNLFRLVFRTIIGLTFSAALIGLWDWSRCDPDDGGYERCDAKIQNTTTLLVGLVPVFIAWIAPNRDGEEDRPPTPAAPLPSPPAASPSFETRSRPTPKPEFGEPPGPDNA